MNTPLVEPIHQSAGSDTNSEQSHALTEWLSWLHQMLPDAARLMLYRVNRNKTVEVAALHPANFVSTEAITNAVLSSVHRQRALYLESLPESVHHLLAIPFQIESTDGAYVLVLFTNALNQIQKNTAVKLTHWAATRLHPDCNHASHDSSVLNSTVATGPEVQLSQVLVNTLRRHGTFISLAFALVNTLASLCGCVRVSLGAHDGKKLQLLAVSGQSKIDDRRVLARQLCALMHQAVVGPRIIYPGGNEPPPAAQTYFKSQGEHPLFSFVMPGSAMTQYVLVLERDESNTFTGVQADAIEQSVGDIATLLELTQINELPLLRKFFIYARKSINGLINLGRWSGRQWLAGIACAAFFCSLVIPATHRVSADATIEASDRQVLVAAQDGFIFSAHARAGELVSEGDLLATLDGQDIELAVQKWRSEKAKNQQEYAQALAIHDRSELSRLRADMQRIEAEIALLEQRLSRSEVRAPFDGVLLDGDWTQSLGAPVTTGDVLFEIASAEQYRLILEVDEHDIGYIVPEQRAELRMSALPTDIWEAQLANIIPVAISEHGRSAFRVPAIIDGDASALRPGMEGIGKVIVGQRSMFWVYSHRLFNKLRLLAWKIGLL